MEEKVIKRRTLGRFSNSVIILIIICLITLLCVLTALWSYLEKYESQTPQSYIQRFLDYVENGDIDSLMKTVDVHETEFFTSEDYGAYLNELLGNDIQNIIIEEKGNDEGGDNQLYYLHLKDKDGITISLSKNENSKGKDLYALKHINLPFKEITVVAPDYVTVVANQTKISEQHKTKEQKPIKGFQTLKDSSLMPKMVSYKIGGFIKEPTFTVDGMDSSTYQIENNKNVITITTTPDKAVKEKIENLGLLASKAYARFVSHDGEFKEFEQYIVKDSSYYKTVRNFDNQWYITHNGVAFENVVVDNTIAYSEKCFSTEVSFDYIVSQNKLKHVYKTKYKLYFLKSGESYKIANLELL